MKIEPVELTGKRAKLVPMDELHVDGLFEAGRYPEIWAYMPMRVETLDDMQRLVAQALAARDAGSEFPFVIVDQESIETLGTIRVQLKTDGRNVRSQRAIERIGAVKEGVLRHHRIMYDGYVRDSVYYSVLVEEWPTVKERLESFLQAGE